MHCENHVHQPFCTRASADTCARAPERHGRGPAPLSERLSEIMRLFRDTSKSLLEGEDCVDLAIYK